jgi:hypothetical protein
MEVKRIGNRTRISVQGLEATAEFEPRVGAGTVHLMLDFGTFRFLAVLPAGDAKHIADELGSAADKAADVDR